MNSFDKENQLENFSNNRTKLMVTYGVLISWAACMLFTVALFFSNDLASYLNQVSQ